MRSLIQACIATLTKATGLNVEYHECSGTEDRTSHDGLLIIRTAAGSDRYTVEAKRSVTANNLPAVLSQLHRSGGTHREPPLLMSAYVPPAIATQLESHGVAYADAVGNAHLDGPAAYVHILGQRPQPAASITGLTATDLTIVFAILCRPRLLHEPLRTIATETGIPPWHTRSWPEPNSSRSAATGFGKSPTGFATTTSCPGCAMPTERDTALVDRAVANDTTD